METEKWQQDQIVHLALVVKDIEKTLADYCRIFRMEMPQIKQTCPEEIAETEYRGRPTPARAKQAFLSFGSMRIELMEPDAHDSTWKEYLEQHGNCVHHIALYVPDMDRALEELEGEEISLVQRGKYRGGKYAYVASEEKLAVMLELLQDD